MTEAVVNLDKVSLQSDSMGTRFAAQYAEIGTVLGLRGLGATYYIVPPGKTAMPFHRHHITDEMFLILSGSGEYRLGDERIPVRAGDCPAQLISFSIPAASRCVTWPCRTIPTPK